MFSQRNKKLNNLTLKISSQEVLLFFAALQTVSQYLTTIFHTSGLNAQILSNPLLFSYFFVFESTKCYHDKVIKKMS